MPSLGILRLSATFVDVNSVNGFREAFNLFTTKQKRKYIFFIALQFFSSLLDLAAIASMGLLTIAAATFNTMSSENGLVTQFLLYLRDHVNGERALFLLLSITSVGLFLLKSDVSIYYSRKVLRFLSERLV